MTTFNVMAGGTYTVTATVTNNSKRNGVNCPAVLNIVPIGNGVSLIGGQLISFNASETKTIQFVLQVRTVDSSILTTSGNIEVDVLSPDGVNLASATGFLVITNPNYVTPYIPPETSTPTPTCPEGFYYDPVTQSCVSYTSGYGHPVDL